ncbi:MAG: hypothetical protein KGJ77_11870 [Acidobacteriota bacterium]|nr:hypothetical protein [Acidobacteriota bacterium]
MAVAPTFADAGWSVVATPALSGQNVFNSVSCASPSFCMAVGENESSLQTLAETWNGSAWSVVATPTPSGAAALTSVSCPSVTFCMVIGRTYQKPKAPITETWDGSQWTVGAPWSTISGSPPSNQHVDCTSPTFCMAVGFATLSPVIENDVASSWDGTGWTTLTPPELSTHYNQLLGVSCTSPSFCMAVGDYSTPNPNPAATGTVDDSVIMTWDGTAWSVLSSPNAAQSTQNVPGAVWCGTPASCVAVGHAKVLDVTGESTLYTETYTWDGSTWSFVLTPEVVTPAAISCADASTCVLAGSGLGAGVLLWDGASWVLPTVATGPPQQAQLNSVSCPTASFCMAVGGVQAPVGGIAPLAETGGTASDTSGTVLPSVAGGASGATTTTTTTTTDAPASTVATTTTPAGAGRKAAPKTGATRHQAPGSTSALEGVALGAGGAVLLGGLVFLGLQLRRNSRRSPVTAGDGPPEPTA